MGKWIHVAIAAAWVAMTVVVVQCATEWSSRIATMLLCIFMGIVRAMKSTCKPLPLRFLVSLWEEAAYFVVACSIGAMHVWSYSAVAAVDATFGALVVCHAAAVWDAAVNYVRSLPVAARAFPKFDMPLVSTERVIQTDLGAHCTVNKVVDCGGDRYLLLVWTGEFSVMSVTPTESFTIPEWYTFADMCQGPAPGTAFLATKSGGLSVLSMTRDGGIFSELVTPDFFGDDAIGIAFTSGQLVTLFTSALRTSRPDGTDAKTVPVCSTLWVNLLVAASGTTAVILQGRRLRAAFRVVGVDLKTLAMWPSTVDVASLVPTRYIVPIVNDPGRFVCWNGAGGGVVMTVGWSALRLAWITACLVKKCIT